MPVGSALRTTHGIADSCKHTEATNRVPGTDAERGNVFLHLGGPKSGIWLIWAWVSVKMAPLEHGGGRSGQQLVVVVGWQSVSIIVVGFSGEEGCGNRDVLVSVVVQRNEGRSWEWERVGGRAPVESHHFRGRVLESNCVEEFIIRLLSKSGQLAVGIGFGLIDNGVGAGGS